MANRTHLSEFEQIVLLAVLRAGDDACGRRIRDDLRKTARRHRSLASIYVVLTRLEGSGFVRSWMSDPTPVRGGRSKRFFAVEPKGVAALQEARLLFEEMWAGVDESLHPESA